MEPCTRRTSCSNFKIRVILTFGLKINAIFFLRFNPDPSNIPNAGKELLAFHESVANHFIDKYYGDRVECTPDNENYYDHTNKCYNVYAGSSIPWVTARQNCISMGGDLASILDTETKNFVREKFWPIGICNRRS